MPTGRNCSRGGHFRRIAPFVWAILIAWAAGGALVSAARGAAIDLKVRLGWGEVLRPGRWLPVTVTASDPSVAATKPLSVRIDLQSLQGGRNVMQIHQFASIGPAPVTYTLYIPFHFSGNGLSIVLRDADTLKTLARWPESKADEQVWNRIPEPGDRLVGVAGEAATLDGFIAAASVRVRAAQIPLDELPQQAIGYDSLDLLVLDRANLNNISQDQQEAIAEWVRSGGALLMWPGDIPSSPGPLQELLPCRVGAPRDYMLSPAVRGSAGLGDGFAVLHGSELRPAADATPIDLLPDAQGHGSAIGYARRTGFGQVIVAPFDISRLVFDDPAASKRFCQPLVERLLLPAPASAGSSQDQVWLREQGALAAFGRQLAVDAPAGASWPGMSLLWIILGAGAICGPIDWLTLKLLGQRPWTWFTLCGWLAVLGAGGMIIVQSAKTAGTRLQTVEIIDQADDHDVAHAILAAVATPKPTPQRLQVGKAADAATSATKPQEIEGASPAEWWQPVADDASAGQGIMFDSTFHQSTDSNTLESTTVDSAGTRLLRGEATRGGPPIVKADLHLTHVGDRRRLTGSIQNVSDRALVDVRVNLGSDFAAPLGSAAAASSPAAEPILIARLEPGQSAAVTGEIAARPPPPGQAPTAAATPAAQAHPADFPFWRIAGDLAGGRSARIESATAGAAAALVTARFADPAAPITLREPAGAVSHLSLLRALVSLRRE